MADDLGRWEPWEPAAVAALLDGVPARWWLSGGRALALVAGGVTRPHGDVDVSVARDDWPAVRARLERRLEVVLARDGALRPLPDRLDDDDRNLWCRERPAGPWRLQVNLEPVIGGRWSYRRHPAITLPLDDVVHEVGGIPCVRPAVQLLWKAAAPRPVDDHDARRVLPLLDPGERAWLEGAVRTAHPGSPWAVALPGAPAARS